MVFSPAHIEAPQAVTGQWEVEGGRVVAGRWGGVTPDCIHGVVKTGLGSIWTAVAGHEAGTHSRRTRIQNGPRPGAGKNCSLPKGRLCTERKRKQARESDMLEILYFASSVFKVALYSNHR